MKILSIHQRNFLLENFFKNEKFPGWRNIANNLLDNGKCIVAGDKCIWNGGIGNWITTNNAKDAYNCLEYSFNLQEFMKSEWFKSIYNQYLDIINEELEEKKQQIFQMEQLTLYKS